MKVKQQPLRKKKRFVKGRERKRRRRQTSKDKRCFKFYEPLLKVAISDSHDLTCMYLYDAYIWCIMHGISYSSKTETVCVPITGSRLVTIHEVYNGVHYFFMIIAHSIYFDPLFLLQYNLRNSNIETRSWWRKRMILPQNRTKPVTQACHWPFCFANFNEILLNFPVLLVTRFWSSTCSYQGQGHSCCLPQSLRLNPSISEWPLTRFHIEAWFLFTLKKKNEKKKNSHESMFRG